MVVRLELDAFQNEVECASLFTKVKAKRAILLLANKLNESYTIRTSRYCRFIKYA